MTFDPEASKRAAAAADRLCICGAKDLLAALVRDVWFTNVARFDPTVGDTVRVIAIQSAENIVQRIQALARRDGKWKATGIEVTISNNSMLIEVDRLRIHFVKLPQISRLHPDWSHDFAWETGSNVRVTAASANDSAYRAPYIEAGIEPMIPVGGLGTFGDPDKVNEFFLVWAGEISEQPLTAGWLVIPSLGQMPVIAAEPLWMDKGADGEAGTVSNGQPTPDVTSEPDVAIRLKKNIAKASNDQ
jgi:hypothetical protein